MSMRGWPLPTQLTPTQRRLHGSSLVPFVDTVRVGGTTGRARKPSGPPKLARTRSGRVA
jgi:hypothetical protein